MMSRVTSHMMSYKMVVSNNRIFYGTLTKNILGWGAQYSELSDPSIFNPSFYHFRHKNAIFTINPPLYDLLSGTIVIIIFIIIIIIPGYHIWIFDPHCYCYHLSIIAMSLVIGLVKDLNLDSAHYLSIIRHVTDDVTGHVNGQGFPLGSAHYLSIIRHVTDDVTGPGLP